MIEKFVQEEKCRRQERRHYFLQEAAAFVRAVG
jgi:hypothetical protein